MKLKDFYRESVQDMDTNQKGWSGLYYGVFSSIIEQNNFKVIAEVGIGYGAHAKFILRNNKNIDRLYLIDPMCYYPNDGFSSAIMEKEPEQPDNNWNELHDLIVEELSPWKDKVTFYRNKSLEITNEQIPDESLDAVFIDGAHDFDNVLADLNFWFKKVKKGGQILGDDYIIPDVNNAVGTFSVSNNMKFDLLSLPNKNYPIFRFFKN